MTKLTLHRGTRHRRQHSDPAERAAVRKIIHAQLRFDRMRQREQIARELRLIRQAWRARHAA